MVDKRVLKTWLPYEKRTVNAREVNFYWLAVNNEKKKKLSGRDID